jgi:predicted nucleotidyltransferase
MRAGMREQSLRRMDEITAYYAGQNGVLAVAAFGSNAARSRFDDCSDLDFLVFAEFGAKERLIEQVGTLAQLGKIDALRVVYGDAVQLLFSDGVLCDFGIITPDQLGTFPHGAGRYLWQRSDWQAIDLFASEPARKPAQKLEEDALFHLYLGLLRLERGEEAAAFDEIQGKATLCVLSLLQGDRADAFSPLRRAENLVSPERLRQLMTGYGNSLEAAEYMMQALVSCQATSLYRAVNARLDTVREAKA